MKKLESSKKKIDVYCVPTDHVGGAETIMKMMANYSARLLPVHIIILTEIKTGFWLENNSGITVHYLGAITPRKGLIRLVKRLSLLSGKYNIRLCFCSQSYLNGMVGLARKINFLRCERLVIRESSNIFSRFTGIKLFQYKLPYYFGYRKANLIICQTNRMKTELLKQFKWLKSSKVIVLGNPIDIEDIDKNMRYLPEIEVKMLCPYLVAAGRLIPEKGFDILIKAFREFHKKYKNYHLLILGEGKERENLTKLINELALGNNVHLIGFIKNVYPYFRESDLCIVPSLSEGFPNVLLQMMAVNDQILSTTCAEGINEIKWIKLCKPGDIEGLYRAMEEKILDKNNKLEPRVYFDHFLNKRKISYYYEAINSTLKTPE